METTVVYWGSRGIMEKKMEAIIFVEMELYAKPPRSNSKLPQSYQSLHGPD